MDADRYNPKMGLVRTIIIQSLRNQRPIKPIKDITDTFPWSRSHYILSHMYAAIHEQRISCFVFISARRTVVRSMPDRDSRKKGSTALQLNQNGSGCKFATSLSIVETLDVRP